MSAMNGKNDKQVDELDADSGIISLDYIFLDLFALTSVTGNSMTFQIR